MVAASVDGVAMAVAILGVLAGCAGDPDPGKPGGELGDPVDTGTATEITPNMDVPPTDTDYGDGDCPPEAQPMSLPVCLETTAPLDYVPQTYSAAGTVVGTVVAAGPFAKVLGAVAVPGFERCAKAGVTDQVEIVDADGAAWVFGWAADGDPVADGRFAPGEALTLDWTKSYTPYDVDTAVLIHDAARLRFAYGGGVAIAPADLDGLVVEPVSSCRISGSQCSSTRYQLAFAGAPLWPGQRAEVTPPVGGPLHVVLGDATFRSESASGETWFAWR